MKLVNRNDVIKNNINKDIVNSIEKEVYDDIYGKGIVDLKALSYEKQLEFFDVLVDIVKPFFYGGWFDILMGTENRHLFLTGGRKSGKTIHVCMSILLWSFHPKYYDTRFLLSRQYSKGVLESMGASFAEALDIINEACLSKGSNIKIFDYFKTSRTKSVEYIFQNNGTGVSFMYTGVDLVFNALKSTPKISLTYYEEASTISLQGIRALNETMRKREITKEEYFSFFKSIYVWNPEKDLLIKSFAENFVESKQGVLHTINYDTFILQGITKEHINEDTRISAEIAKATDFKQYQKDYLGIVNYAEDSLACFDFSLVSTQHKKYRKKYDFLCVGIDPTIHSPTHISDFTAVAVLGIYQNAQGDFSYDLWGKCFRKTIKELFNDIHGFKKIIFDDIDNAKVDALMIEKNIIGDFFQDLSRKPEFKFINYVDQYMATKDSKIVRIYKFLGDMPDNSIKVLLNRSNNDFLLSLSNFNDNTSKTRYYDDGIDASAYAVFAFKRYLKKILMRNMEL